MRLTRTRSKLAASVAVVGILAATASLMVFSAFSSVTSSQGNTFKAGTIALSDNDAGTALFTVTGLKPLQTVSRCIKVSHASTGGLASTVRLYGATSAGATFTRWLGTKITRGSFPGAAPAGNACTGFAADTVDYDGAGPKGAGVLFDMPLQELPADYDHGIVDPDASWTDGESAVYRIDVMLIDNNDVQGQSATQEFAFEARNA